MFVSVVHAMSEQQERANIRGMFRFIEFYFFVLNISYIAFEGIDIDLLGHEVFIDKPS